MANALTKALVSDKFTLFRSSLNVVNTPMDSRGHINVDKYVINSLGVIIVLCKIVFDISLFIFL